MRMIETAVIGASGYAGGELLRWLLAHPSSRLACVAAGEAAGRPLADVWPALRGHADDPSLQRLEATDGDRLGRAVDVVFVALPSAAGIGVASAAAGAGARVIDLGGGFRLRDPEAHARWYGGAHPAPGLVASAVYGLSEMARDALPGARLVANPGCYPTAAVLALAPLVREGLAGGTIVVDAKSGVSGAGRSPTERTTFGHVDGNVEAYAAGTHRHGPEIEQALADVAAGAEDRGARPPRVVFTPHLVPMMRGILATCYVPLARELDGTRAAELYRDAYADAPFVRVLDDLPSTRATLGSNHCDIAVRVDPERGVATAIAALDNLVKGAAGQAVQNMNLMTGRPETEGLWSAPLFP